MNDTARLIALHKKLLDTLRSISEHADAVNRERCPYRGAGDRCSLPYGCRNQVLRDAERYCSGAQLNYSAP